MSRDIVPFDATVNALSTDAIGLDIKRIFSDPERGVQVVSNYDLSDRVGMERLALSETPAEATLDEMRGRTIEIEGFVAAPVEATDERGEIKEFIRLALFTAGGEQYWSSSSEGILKSIQFCCIKRGMGVWVPPVRAEVIVKNTTGPKRFHMLRILPEREEGNAKPKAKRSDQAARSDG